MIGELGSGAFGEVWKAELDESSAGGVPGHLVAVKKVKLGAPESEREELLKEALLMAQFSGADAGHPNVISLVGVVEDGAGPTLAVIAYCENGSLESFLTKHAKLATGERLDGAFRIGVGQQVTRGMAFLAGRSLVHRDLASRNVLVDSRRSCRVSDFDMARKGKSRAGLSDESVYVVYSPADPASTCVPVRWTAPEVVESMPYRFTTASDVWAYGMLMIEVYTDGATPLAHIPFESVFDWVGAGNQPQQPANCPPVVYATLQQCWSLDSSQRPSFAKLVASFVTLGSNHGWVHGVGEPLLYEVAATSNNRGSKTLTNAAAAPSPDSESAMHDGYEYPSPILTSPGSTNPAASPDSESATHDGYEYPTQISISSGSPNLGGAASAGINPVHMNLTAQAPPLPQKAYMWVESDT
jgi:serine/threonine protein kinase